MSGVVPERDAAPLLRVVAPVPADDDLAPGPVRRALAGLDHRRSPAQVLCSVAAAAGPLGFDRVVVVPLDGATPPTAHVEGDARETARLQLLDLSALAALLTHVSAGAPEPDLVTDRGCCGTVAALLDDRVAVPGFVLAPVVADGAVVAVLYGDLARTRAVPGAVHVDRLATFAVAVGHVLLGARLRDTLARVSLALGVGVAERGPARAATRVPVGGCGALSVRETDVVRLIAAGRTNAQVGRQLRISEGTVKSHVKSVFHKLHAANRAEAVARWLAQGEPPSPGTPLPAAPATPPERSGRRWN